MDRLKSALIYLVAGSVMCFYLLWFATTNLPYSEELRIAVNFAVRRMDFLVKGMTAGDALSTVVAATITFALAHVVSHLASGKTYTRPHPVARFALMFGAAVLVFEGAVLLGLFFWYLRAPSLTF